MPNWLAKASGAASRPTEEQPQEFQLSCECGQLHRGHRKSKPQRIICQTCGAALFILPRNVYPILKPQVPRRRRKKKPRARSGELPSLGSITRGVGRGTASAARTVGRAVKSTGQSVERRIVERVTGWGRFLRAQLTPFRLVLAGIMIMLTVTGVWAFHNRRLELAAETLRVEFEAGEAALRNDDLLAAVGHFEKAAAAADYLESTDTRSRQARQLLHEATAMTQLSSASLLDILEEAERTVSGGRPELWENRFRATYADTWIVLDAPIQMSPDPDGQSSVTIDVPLVVGEMGRSVRVTASVPDVEPLQLTDEPRQAIFAAALTGCELDSGEDRWHVTLSGESGFLWTDMENLRRLGYFESEWISEDETRELLDSQARQLGLR